MMAVERPQSGSGTVTSPVATAASAIQLSLSSLVPRQIQNKSSYSTSNISSLSSSSSSSPATTPRITLNRSFSNITALSSSLSNLTNLSASSSAVLKERLSQLKDAAVSRHEAAATAVKRNIDFVPATVPPLYMVWVFIDKAPENGGRSNRWFRTARFWRYFAEYYPASMKKEQDLPADRPYIFGYHPHGIIGMGALATFATESTGFSAAYPGIRPRLLTLASNFRMPFYRDILLLMGVCSVSKRSCSNILKRGKGAAICIVVGGAAESLSAHPGTADLTLRKRLGFIKLAIQHGADLVPVFSFGENDIFQQMSNQRGTMTYTVQKKFQAMFGFTLPLFHGRGILNYNLGLMPYRRRIVSVIGRPISVVQCDKPNLDQIHEVQKRYIEELYRIWDTYKDAFAAHRKKELKIID